MKVCSHKSCVLAAIRGLSRGITYGAKVRFTHSIVMAMLFGRGSWKERAKVIVKNTVDHGRKLGTYVFIYKSLQCLFAKLLSRKMPINSFAAGAVAGFLVFSAETPINSQITLYLFSRVSTAIVALLYRRKVLPQIGSKYSFNVMTTFCWALVMYLFERNRSVLQNSLTRSMVYLYDESDKWQGIIDFLPYADSIKNLFKLS